MDKKLRVGQWVHVTWDDATSGAADEAWTDISEAIKKAGVEEVQSAGRVIKITKRELILAAWWSKGAEGKVQVGHVFTIPRGWIRKVRFL